MEKRELDMLDAAASAIGCHARVEAGTLYIEREGMKLVYREDEVTQALTDIAGVASTMHAERTMQGNQYYCGICGWVDSDLFPNCH